MGKLVEPGKLPVHRGLDNRIAAWLLVPGLPDDLNKAGRRLLALPLGERLIEPAEELSQRIRHSVLTGQNTPTQHDDGPASPATCRTTWTPVPIPCAVPISPGTFIPPPYRRRIPDGRHHAALPSTRAP